MDAVENDFSLKSVVDRNAKQSFWAQLALGVATKSSASVQQALAKATASGDSAQVELLQALVDEFMETERRVRIRVATHDVQTEAVGGLVDALGKLQTLGGSRGG